MILSLRRVPCIPLASPIPSSRKLSSLPSLRTRSNSTWNFSSVCPLSTHRWIVPTVSKRPTVPCVFPTVSSSSSPSSSWNVLFAIAILCGTGTYLSTLSAPSVPSSDSDSTSNPLPDSPSSQTSSSSGTPTAPAPFSAEEFTYQLKGILDLFRRIYGMPNEYGTSTSSSSSSGGSRSSVVSSSSPRSETSASAALRRPMVRLFRRPLVDLNEETADKSSSPSSLGYEIVMDIQFLPTPLAVPNPPTTTPEPSSSTDTSNPSSLSSPLSTTQTIDGKSYTQQSITHSTVIAIHLLYEIYHNLHHQSFALHNPSNGQTITSSLPSILSLALNASTTPKGPSVSSFSSSPTSPSLSEPATFIFRIRPDLMVTVRPTNEGNSTEICWKPIPSAPATGTRTTSPLGLTVTDVQAIAYLFGNGARDWNISRQTVSSLGTSPVSQERILRQREQDTKAMLSFIQAVTSIASSEYTRKIGQTMNIDTTTTSTSSSSPRFPSSSRSPSNNPVIDDDSFDTSDGHSSSSSSSSPSFRSYFGDKNSLDPKSQPLQVLKSFGIKYYSRKNNSNLDWKDLAGYDTIQKEIEDSVLFPMQHPELYNEIVHQTRMKPESNLHGTYLFSGPPGTGKTTTARILAALTDRPLVVLNFETIGSMYFSASETNLAKVLEAVAAIPNAILFIDEAESMFPSRYGGTVPGDSTPSGGGAGGGGRSTTADISNKMLAQMLTFIEGMEGTATTNVIFASNRPETLDPALLSRCAATVAFDLPTASQRTEIWKRYAKHLAASTVELPGLVEDTEGFSARDIKKICEIAERRHIAELQRQGITQVDAITPPSVKDYEIAIDERWDNLLLMNNPRGKGGKNDSSSRSKGGSRRHRSTSPPPLYRSERLPSYGSSSASASTTSNVHYRYPYRHDM